jgi:hypothetical protein
MNRAALASFLFLAKAAAIVLLVTGTAGAQDERTCRAKTKTMGCALETSLSALEATQRAVGTAVSVPPTGGMKCEVDSPSITPKKAKAATGDPMPCPEDEPADDSDVVIDLCKTASTQVFDKCKSVCAKFRKRDSVTGQPVPDNPCRVVVDRSIVSTEVTRFVDRDQTDGRQFCAVQCKASILCVCDP